MSNIESSGASSGAADPSVGYFVFSLDMELAWGDLWGQPQPRIQRDGAAEREVIVRLLEMMCEFGVAATWAVTGHLFFDRCEECPECPVLELKGQDSRFEDIWGTRNTMWYGADVITELLAADANHEIGFHGYTHRTFDLLSERESRFEIDEWLRLGTRRGIVPHTVIFPQGRIEHLDVFRDAGFLCYRGKEVAHPLTRIPVLGRVVNKINLKLAVLAPQLFAPTVDSLGLVNIPGSMWLFRMNRSIELLLDSLHLHTLRLRPAARAIDRAAAQKKVIHFWVHPQEFRTEKDFAKLRFLFERFALHARAGQLQSITMVELAQQTLSARNCRHQGHAVDGIADSDD